jgi:hypothetical protein
MIDDTLEKLEAEIRASRAVGGEKESDLLELLHTLKEEIVDLSEDDAKSIAGFARVSTHEVIREKSDERLVNMGLDGLKTAVEEMEASHPRLVGVVNAICHQLANLGI